MLCDFLVVTDGEEGDAPDKGRGEEAVGGEETEGEEEEDDDREGDCCELDNDGAVLLVLFVGIKLIDMILTVLHLS